MTKAQNINKCWQISKYIQNRKTLITKPVVEKLRGMYDHCTKLQNKNQILDIEVSGGGAIEWEH